MSMDIYNYTKNKVEQLEKEKKSITYFQERELLLTLTLDEFLYLVRGTTISMSADSVFSFHGLENSRELYVFDMIGLGDVKDDENAHLLDFVEKTLKIAELSINMKMNREQRERFDALVREKERNNLKPRLIENISTWEGIVKRIAFKSVPDSAVLYLENLHKDILKDMTDRVIEKTNKYRVSDEEIQTIMTEYLKELALDLFKLRQFDWQSVENYMTSLKRKRRV